MGRFSRQILLFGDEGQQVLSNIRVAIIGLGGLGSHVSQQLAYLGIRKFGLVDGDMVEETNLNRLIGATADDVPASRPKVDVAERMIKAVDPEVQVERVGKSFISLEGRALLSEADFVIGCVDNDGARLALTAVCAALHKPYMDVATDIDPDDTPINYGGRIIFAKGASGCCHCLGALDDREIERWMGSEDQLAADDRIYGSGAAGPSPSVVCLNGVLASAACLEFMVEVTGLREANRWLEYDGPSGKMRVDSTVPTGWCPYCESFKYGSTEYVDWMLSRLPQTHR
jgi:hypothetical protein